MKLKKLRIPFSVWFAINFLARQRRIIPHFPGLSAEAFSFVVTVLRSIRALKHTLKGMLNSARIYCRTVHFSYFGRSAYIFASVDASFYCSLVLLSFLQRGYAKANRRFQRY
jgi:hypothetical protein